MLFHPGLVSGTLLMTMLVGVVEDQLSPGNIQDHILFTETTQILFSIDTLCCRVINVDSESRKEALEQAKGDTKSAARNKRMFGNLLGTLQKFTKDEVKQKEVVEKQKVALLKVEEKTEREKEEMRNRKRELFDEQRKKKKDIQILQIQLKRTEEFEAWEASKKSEVNFIRTKGEQNPIYWLPKNHSEKTEGLLSETKTAVEKELEEKREAFEQELVGIEKRMVADLERRQQQFNNRPSHDGEREGGLDQVRKMVKFIMWRAHLSG